MAVGLTGSDIQSFTFTFQYDAYRNHNNNLSGGYDLRIYMLDVVDPTTTGTSLFTHGPDDTANHALVGVHSYENDTVNPDTGGGSVNINPVITVSFNIDSGASLAMLQNLYGASNTPSQNELSFRFNLSHLYDSGTEPGSSLTDSGVDYNLIDPINSNGLNRYRLVNNPLDGDDNPIDTFTMSVIPEPATALLGGLGLLALLRRRR